MQDENMKIIDFFWGEGHAPEMEWYEKLERLMADRNVSAVSRAVGLHPQRLGTQIALRQMPRADRAVRLARQLGVDCDWLFDAGLGWPPRQVEVGETPHGSVQTAARQKVRRESTVAVAISLGAWRGRRSLRVVGPSRVIEAEDFKGQGGFVPVVAPIAAGEPREAHDGDFAAGAADAYVAFDVDDENAFALRVDGDSMKPDFLHGDIIIASPRSRSSREATHRDGMLGVVIFGSERTATFKVVRFGAMNKSADEPMDYVLQPLNAAFPPMRLKRGEVSAIYPVVGLVRKE